MKLNPLLGFVAVTALLEKDEKLEKSVLMAITHQSAPSSRRYNSEMDVASNVLRIVARKLESSTLSYKHKPLTECIALLENILAFLKGWEEKESV